MIEQIEKRTRNSKTHSLGGCKFAWDGSIGAIHYEDNGWQEIDNIFESAIAPWNWQMLRAGYHTRAKEDFTAGQIIEFEKQGEAVQLQPMALEWTNDLDQIQPVSMPQSVIPAITNPEVDLLPAVGVLSHQGTIRWNDAYGDGIDFEWRCTSTRLVKTLEIEGLNKLPPPEQYIIDGGNPVLRLNLIFDPSSGVDIYVDGELWDKKAKKQTFDIIEFRKDGEVLWGFMPLRYWGSGSDRDSNTGQSEATVEKQGNSLYISIRVPYSWLQGATYPIFVDADIDEQVGANLDDAEEVESDGGMETGQNWILARSFTSPTYRHWVGCRFTGLSAISQGDTIDAATWEVYCDWYDDPNLNIHFEHEASPIAFAAGNFNITNRTRTTASAPWVANNIGTSQWRTSPSIVTPLQELVNAHNITTAVLITRPNQDLDKMFDAVSYEADSTKAAKLHIDFTAGAAGPAGVKTLEELAIASVKTINDCAIASVKTIQDSAA